MDFANTPTTRDESATLSDARESQTEENSGLSTSELQQEIVKYQQILELVAQNCDNHEQELAVVVRQRDELAQALEEISSSSISSSQLHHRDHAARGRPASDFSHGFVRDVQFVVPEQNKHAAKT
eukprot:1187481-Rhodomonas_salina.1